MDSPQHPKRSLKYVIAILCGSLRRGRFEEHFSQNALDNLLSSGKLRVVEYQAHKYVVPSEFVFGLNLFSG